MLTWSGGKREVGLNLAKSNYQVFCLSRFVIPNIALSNNEEIAFRDWRKEF
jgi:hypothetical protein